MKMEIYDKRCICLIDREEEIEVFTKNGTRSIVIKMNEFGDPMPTVRKI